MEINYTDKKEQVFIITENKGYLKRIKIENPFEKQDMYMEYPLCIQTGFRCLYVLKVWFSDGSHKCINPNKIRINNSLYIGVKPIETISLERGGV